MAERTKAAVSKTVEPVFRFRGFESLSLRGHYLEDLMLSVAIHGLSLLPASQKSTPSDL